jgi:glutathione S-transferase
MRLYIGHPTVSSWSLRGWLAARKTGLEFEESYVAYRTKSGKKQLNELSPNALVPLLVHQRDGREVEIFESLAVCEYLAELAPQARLWPADPGARGVARSYACQMHAGFGALRVTLDMSLLERLEVTIDEAARNDIARVEAIWTKCRETWGGAGPWLFGHFTIADAMFAPIATRFRTYGVQCGAVAADYQATVLADPDMLVWEDMARNFPPLEAQPD